MKLLIAILLIACSVPATAGELIIDTVSYHSNKTYIEEWSHTVNGEVVSVDHNVKHYNNVNPGIGYRSDDGWSVGYYYNSYKFNTFYVAKDYMFTERFGAFAGLATGYGYANNGRPINLIGGFDYRIPLTDTITLHTMFLPPIGPMTGVVHLAVSYQLGK